MADLSIPAPGVATACRRLAETHVPDSFEREHGVIAVPQWIIARPSGSMTMPPATRLLQARRGGAETRLRLLVWLVALSRSGAVPTLTLPSAAALGSVLGLASSQERRVFAATRGLVEESVLARAGRGRVTLIDQAGDPWTRRSTADWEAHHRERNDLDARWGAGAADRHPTLWMTADLELPNAAIVSGTVSVLSASAIVALLALLDARTLDPGSGSAWFRSRRRRSVRYGFSYDTFRKGVVELESAGIVETRSRSTASTPDIQYRIDDQRLGRTAVTQGPKSGAKAVRHRQRVPFRTDAPPAPGIEDPCPGRCSDCMKYRRGSDGAWYAVPSTGGRFQSVWWCKVCSGAAKALPAPPKKSRRPAISDVL